MLFYLAVFIISYLYQELPNSQPTAENHSYPVISGHGSAVSCQTPNEVSSGFDSAQQY